MKKIIKLTESDLTKIVKRVIVEMTDEKLSPMDWVFIGRKNILKTIQI